MRGEHLAALHAALLQAFDLDSLERMVKLRLDRDLATLVPLRDHNLSEVVYSLVRWAADDPEIGVKGLLAAAWETNPGNSTLVELQAAWASLVFDARPGCPYPGMQAFTERQSQHFFGREAEVAEALQRLRLHPFLIVIGASGSGKSSLAYAGIVPAMQRSSFFGGEPLAVCAFRPGAAPLHALAAALGCAAPESAGPEELVACAEQRTRTAPALLLVDQFEETYTLASPAQGSEQGETQAELFQKTLLRLAGLSNLYLLVTARADFYVNLMNSPLWPLIQAHRLEITTLGEEALRSAITLPAQAVGVTVQEGLVERLVADAAGEPGALPFLQETLVLLWDKLQHAELPLEAYTQLASGQSGRTGLQVAMALRADAALADPRLPAGGQAIARRIFLRLVQFGEGRPNTRRQQVEADLRATGDNPAAFDAVLALLIACRLLSASGDSQGAGRRIDIAHEALLSGWPTLAAWVGERRQAEIERRRLEGKAAEWVRLGRGDAGLLDRVELKEAAAYLDGPDGADLGASPDLLALAAASRKAVDPGWNGRGVLGLAGGALAVLALLAAGLFYLQTNLLALAARVALLLFWVALVVGLLLLLWLLRRSDPQILKRWSQTIGGNRRWQSGLAAAAAAACVVWLAIGAWALPIQAQCTALGLGSSDNTDEVAVISKNVGDFETQVFARMLQRASSGSVEGWSVTEDTARTCASFFRNTVLLEARAGDSGNSAYFVDKLDPRSNETTHLVPGYGVTEGCQGLLYTAFEAAAQLGYNRVNLDQALLTAGDPPCSAVLVSERGVDILDKLGDLDTAEQHFRQALALYPEYVDALNNLGLVYIRRRDPEHALEYLRTAIALLPQPSWTVYGNLGNACYYALDMPCAEKAYLQSLALTTAPKEKMSFYNSLFQVHRHTHNYVLAHQILEQYKLILHAIPEPETADEVLLARDEGVLAFAEARYAEAWQHLTTADTLQESDGAWAEEVVYYLAKTAEKLGRSSEACDYWKRYTSIKPSLIFGETERRADAQQSAATSGCAVNLTGT